MAGVRARGWVVFGAAGVALVLWASVYSALRVALVDISAEHLAFLRLAIASLALGGYGLLARESLPGPRHWPRLAVIGVIGFAAYWLLLNLGQRTVDAGAASFIINTTPALSALLAVLFLKERLTVLGVTGIAVSLAGVALIIVSGRGGLHLKVSTGALILVAAALVHAMHFVLQKPALEVLSPFQVTLGSMWAGTVCLLPWAPGAVTALAEAPASVVATVVYAGVFPSAVSHVTWAFVLAHMTAARATSLLVLISPMAAVIGAVWLGERMPLLAWCGGAVALAGVVMVQTRGRAAAYPASPAVTKAPT